MFKAKAHTLTKGNESKIEAMNMKILRSDEETTRNN
jgi:hypothetical protein